MSNFSTKIFGLAGAAAAFAGMAFGQQATCAAPVATTTIIRAEGRKGYTAKADLLRRFVESGEDAPNCLLREDRPVRRRSKAAVPLEDRADKEPARADEQPVHVQP